LKTLKAKRESNYQNNKKKSTEHYAMEVEESDDEESFSSHSDSEVMDNDSVGPVLTMNSRSYPSQEEQKTKQENHK
jgi:hypothetical protein